MKTSRRKHEKQLPLKVKTQPKLFLAHVRRNRHLKKSIISLKDNKSETISTPSAQTEITEELLFVYFSRRLCKTHTNLPVPRVVMPWRSPQFRLFKESSLVSMSQKELAKRLIFMKGLSFQDLLKSAFIHLYGAVVRTHLEHGMPACLPNLVADINHQERIQR